MTELSGRTLESLQAEANLLDARHKVDYYETYLTDLLTLQVILTSLTDHYSEHTRLLGNWLFDIEKDVTLAKKDIARANDRLKVVEADWAQQDLT